MGGTGGGALEQEEAPGKWRAQAGSVSGLTAMSGDGDRIEGRVVDAGVPAGRLIVVRRERIVADERRERGQRAEFGDPVELTVDDARDIAEALMELAARLNSSRQTGKCRAA